YAIFRSPFQGPFAVYLRHASGRDPIRLMFVLVPGLVVIQLGPPTSVHIGSGAANGEQRLNRTWNAQSVVIEIRRDRTAKFRIDSLHCKTEVPHKCGADGDGVAQSKVRVLVVRVSL